MRKEATSANLNQQIPSRRFRRGMAVALLGTGAVIGGTATHVVEGAIDNARANAAQPACDVPIHSGDTIIGIESRIKRAGDDVRGEDVEVITPGGRVRNGYEDPRFFVDGSMAAQAGDIARIQNVDPNVCLKVGGVILNDDGSRK